MPWKNGKGVTREIVCRPEAATLDRFDWRVSLAHIAAPGPFSTFDGIDRTIVLLQGAGVVLQGLGEPYRLQEAYQPFAFAGEAKVYADLIGGPSEDLNVMTRRGVCSAKVQLHQTEASVGASSSGFVLALRGQWALTLPGQARLLLEAGQGVWWDSDDIAAPANAWAAHWQISPLAKQTTEATQTTDPCATLLWVSVQGHNSPECP
jgi:environmental stress-induced protein Ves